MIVDQEVWEQLVTQYGYNFDLPRLSIQVPTEDPKKKDYIVEVHLRRFELRTSPNVKYHEQVKMPHRFYISRSSTVKEMHLKICDQIEHGSVRMNAFELFQVSRLWVFE